MTTVPYPRGPMTVSWPLRARLLGVGKPAPEMAMRLFWTSARPLEVHCEFPADGVRWVIGRELFVAGLTGPTGLGDVTLLPDLEDPDGLELILSSPDGRLGLRIPTIELAAFLRATHTAPVADLELADWEW